MRFEYFIIGWCARAIVGRIEREIAISRMEREFQQEIKAAAGVFATAIGKQRSGKRRSDVS